MRIGLIGAGAVAALHVRAAQSLPGVQVTDVCDLDPARAESVAAPVGARTTTDYGELLCRGDLDAVIVNTPHALHRDMVVEAAAAGLHVLVEKPMATSLADCDAMTEACRAAGVTLAVGHIQHFLPEKLAVERALLDEEIGAVRLVHDFRNTDYRPGTRPDWFLSPAVAGGGALMNIGAHCLDRTVWFGGRATSVTAHTTNRFGAGVETDGTILLELEESVAATVTVVSTGPGYTDRLTVVGESGVLVADAREGAFLRRGDTVTTLWEPGPTDIEDAFRRQLADFVAGARGNPLRVSLGHSRHVVELVLTAYRSAHEGCPIPLGQRA